MDKALIVKSIDKICGSGLLKKYLKWALSRIRKFAILILV